MNLRGLFSLVKLLLCLLVIVLLTGTTYLWFEGNDLLRRLTPRIEVELGRNFKAKVEISDLKAKIFPKFEISMSAVTINPENSCASISAEQGALSIDLLALIRGKYIINSVSLVSARARVSVINGAIRLVSKLGADSNSDCIQSAEDIAPVEDSQATPIFLKLKKIKIKDLQLSIEGSKEHKLIIEEFSSVALLENGNLALNSPKIKASFDSIPISLTAHTVQIDLNALTFAVEAGIISVAEQVVQISGKFDHQVISGC